MKENRRRNGSSGGARAAIATVDGTDRDALAGQYASVRETTLRLAAPLSPEDCVLQSMPDASPVKWHLAHTTWFFETFVLEAAAADYRPFDPAFRVLYNSYYNTVGAQHARPERGLISRPDLERIRAYRAHVDEAVQALMTKGAAPLPHDLSDRIELGLHHEQQHQELVLTDLKHLLFRNPTKPAYRAAGGRASHRPSTSGSRGPSRTPAAAESGRRIDRAAGTSPTGAEREATGSRKWLSFAEGIRWIGAETGAGFAFDNERPRHRALLEAFEIGSSLVTNRDFLEFIEDSGYHRPDLWLSDGWDAARRGAWEAPLYWEGPLDDPLEFTLAGLRPLDLDAPVCHVSYYEADAFARWAGARLATEAEWETAAQSVPIEGNFQEDGIFHPQPPAAAAEGRMPLLQMFGDVWEWTQSPYVAYPRYRPLEGALGEYNGKFMCNQLVLRGGSCATPRSHIRASYRNFVPPSARWQFMGIRLARDPRP